MKIRKTLTNTTHVRCCLSRVCRFFILFYFFGLCSLDEVPIVYVFRSSLMHQLPFIILCIIIFSKAYIDKSISFVKLVINMCESVFDIKDCNIEVLTYGIVEHLHFYFWKLKENSIQLWNHTPSKISFLSVHYMVHIHTIILQFHQWMIL